MKKILFICHGNICRSPMAECIMKHMLDERGLTEEFVIDSKATSTEEIGSPIHRGTLNVLRKHNIPIVEHRASRLCPEDYAEYDYLICMDARNKRNMKPIIGDDTDAKVRLLLEFAGSKEDIADPWYTGDFDRTYDDIDRACRALLDKLID